ncbi:MAG: nicotinate-nucleotide--dimethylbenzimidazole phosphoribosyltransferase, partial [Spirochaetaceae bacterium]|nr:nicotinate-nucleotide--dimethylbenzimidazole phosphoribosyltransferase [Spirochaetaceae bacterium]
MDETVKLMQAHLDNLTKPRGSLGKLEDYCLKMARIQNKVPPEITKKSIYVFAGDHGIAAEGVSLYPQEVSRQMALNMFSGGAGINALSLRTGWELNVVDAGLLGDDFPPDSELKPSCNFIRNRITNGSKNFYHQSAMTETETETAIEKGKELARSCTSDLTAIGDLGIGNTSTAAAMIIAAGFDADKIIDRGTGIDDKMLEHKRKVIIESVKRRGGVRKDGKIILRELGSPDFAMMTGFILGLEGRACVLDGFPVTSAAYMAYLINPKVTDRLFAGHLSKVAGHKPVLDALGLDPIVRLDMHLGEGTGAVIGGYIIELGV